MVSVSNWNLEVGPGERNDGGRKEEFYYRNRAQLWNQSTCWESGTEERQRNKGSSWSNLEGAVESKITGWRSCHSTISSSIQNQHSATRLNIILINLQNRHRWQQRENKRILNWERKWWKELPTYQQAHRFPVCPERKPALRTRR